MCLDGTGSDSWTEVPLAETGGRVNAAFDNGVDHVLQTTKVDKPVSTGCDLGGPEDDKTTSGVGKTRFRLPALRKKEKDAAVQTVGIRQLVGIINKMINF
jgi:hypothetical protein